MGNTQTWLLTTSSSAGRSTPAHLARQGDKCRGDRDGLAYRGTARAVRRVLGVPRQLGLRFDRWAISGSSSGPNEALDRLWWPQSAISGHIRTSTWRGLEDLEVVPAPLDVPSQQRQWEPCAGEPQETAGNARPQLDRQPAVHPARAQSSSYRLSRWRTRTHPSPCAIAPSTRGKLRSRETSPDHGYSPWKPSASTSTICCPTMSRAS